MNPNGDWEIFSATMLLLLVLAALVAAGLVAGVIWLLVEAL